MKPRIPPLTPPYTAELRTMLEKWMPPGAGVEPLRLFRTLARHPVLSDRMRPLGAALRRGTLAPRVRELLVLRTCARCGAEYEWGVHVTAFAVAAGLDEAAVDATVRRPPAAVAASEGLDDRVMRLVDELHDSGTVTEGTWARLTPTFDDVALLEMLATVGFYHLISFVANAARIEHEPWAARFSG